MAVYQGPIKPGTSEQKYRDTGKSVPLYQGPVPRGYDEKTFRETGKTIRIYGGGGGGGGAEPQTTQATPTPITTTGITEESLKKSTPTQAPARTISEQVKSQQGAVPDVLAGTQFGRGHFPTATDIRGRTSQAKQIFADPFGTLPYFGGAGFSTKQEDVDLGAGEFKVDLGLSTDRLTGGFPKDRGTIMGTGKKADIPFYTSSTLIERQTGTFKSPSGKDIPVTGISYGEWEDIGGGAKEWKERIATSEETEYFREQTNVLQASTEKVKWYEPSKEKALGGYESINLKLKESFTYPIFGGMEKVSGIDVTNATQMSAFTPSIIGIGPFGIKPAPKQDFLAGFSSAVLLDIKEKPLKQIVLFGAGAGLGAGVSATVTGISKISPVAAGITRGTLTIGGVALGGAYALDIGTKAISAPTLSEAGGIIGVGTKDIVLVGAGYKTGAKGFEMARGWYATRGREELIIPQAEYPAAATTKQLSMFRKNIVIELGEKPGAFHVTSQKFWKGEITPSAGTSELPGLYGSTQISTPFAKIPGSTGTSKWLPSLKELFAPPSKPAVAYLTPEGFRYSPAGKTTPYYIGEQKFEYAFYNKPVKGYADVPGIKTEIEAIFRPEAGSYSFVSGKYYTTISNVRVPIDAFKFNGEILPSVSAAPVKTFIPSSYSLPSSTIKPEFSFPLIGSIRSSVKSISSYVSYPSPSSVSVSRTSRLTGRYSYVQPSYSYAAPSMSLSSMIRSSKAASYSMQSYMPSSTSRSYAPPISIPRTPIQLPPFIPNLGLGLPKTKGLKTPRTFRYQASIGAILSGLKAPKISKKEKFAEFTGFQARPVIIGRRSSRTFY